MGIWAFWWTLRRDCHKRAKWADYWKKKKTTTTRIFITIINRSFPALLQAFLLQFHLCRKKKKQCLPRLKRIQCLSVCLFTNLLKKFWTDFDVILPSRLGQPKQAGCPPSWFSISTDLYLGMLTGQAKTWPIHINTINVINVFYVFLFRSRFYVF